MSEKIILKLKCGGCNQFKGVFDVDRYGRKKCIECGNVLKTEELIL